jgi:hypothetical protein
MAKLCSNCGFDLPLSAKFCPECGAKVEAALAEGEVPTEGVPDTGFTIEFSFSSSANYPFSVERASRHPSYRERGEGKQKIHRLTYQPPEVDQMLELLEALKGTRNRRVWVNGEKMMWDEAFEWVWCYSQRKSAYVPDQYCFGEDEARFNLWGCVNSRMAFGAYERWLAHGAFDKSGTFTFDKQRIRHELLTALHRYRLCPAFDAQLVQDVLSAFPDQVNPQRDRDWDYQPEFGGTESPGSLVVRIKEYGMTREERMAGVRPKSLEAARKVFSKINRKLPAPKDLKFD